METKFNYMELVNLTDDEAREMIEKIRWADGMFCPHCGTTEKFYKIMPKAESKRPARRGVYKCASCRKQFTVTVGTIFEDSHVRLGIWLAVFHLMCASKKGMSAHEIHRLFGITYKAAWFMTHRIRLAMEQEQPLEKMSGTVEADETYIGGVRPGPRGRGAKNKSIVFSLVERNGNVRSQKVQNVTGQNLRSIVDKNVKRDSTIMTDDFRSYKSLDNDFKKHEIINHSSKIYVNGNIHTNTIEGFFSNLKRGVNGTFHHISEQHLNLYLNEFDFRYNSRKITDIERTKLAIAGIEGKRLVYGK
jgi:transposase-like protein/DNA-directed RNA polymerase subunit RPC12/RpoP